MDPVTGFINALYQTGTENRLLVFGVASGVLSTFAYIPYIIDTMARRTQPQRASWLIWSVLGSIAFFSQVFEGASTSLWFAGVQVTGTIIVFLLSIRTGIGAYLTRSDYAVLSVAAMGLVLWYFTETATYALAITISISLLGGLATAVKAYRDPDSETLTTWVVSLIASVCAVLSVGRFDPVLLAYPLYLLTLYTAFVIAILAGRVRRKARTALRPGVALKPVASLALLRSGLRVTADTVIVAAALLVSFNWLMTGTGESLSRESESRTERGEGAVLPAAVINTAGWFDGIVSGAVAATHSDATMLTSPAVPSPLQNINSRQPLHEALAEVKPAIVIVAMLAEDGQLLRVTDASETKVADVINRITPDVKKAAAEPAKAVSRSVGKSIPFLALDAGDPFTKLVVNHKAAELIVEPLEGGPVSAILPKGESVQALETNGQWFLARTSNGHQGYIHHSLVEVETLASIFR
jgi:hypothetical protein